jgi:hypothetical protein
MQKSVAFLYTHKEQVEKEIRKMIHSLYPQKYT